MKTFDRERDIERHTSLSKRHYSGTSTPKKWAPLKRRSRIKKRGSQVHTPAKGAGAPVIRDSVKTELFKTEIETEIEIEEYRYIKEEPQDAVKSEMEHLEDMSRLVDAFNSHLSFATEDPSVMVPIFPTRETESFIFTKTLRFVERSPHGGFVDWRPTTCPVSTSHNIDHIFSYISTAVSRRWKV